MRGCPTSISAVDDEAHTHSHIRTQNLTQPQTLEMVDSEEDEEAPNFRPLNATLSYLTTSKGLEIAPTLELRNSLLSSSSTSSVRYSKKYGSPTENNINTRHVSGKKIDKKHAKYALSAGMMLGVRECVGGMSNLHAADADDMSIGPGGVQKKQLTLEEECLRVEKIKIPAGAYFVSANMASLPYRYKFKAYAPVIFHRIRDMAGVDKQLFLHSICGSDAFIEFVSNAKSGQFFFYSHDGRYMIKTQTQEEKTFLRQILPDYYNHMKNNPHSFLTHFYGMYRVKIPDLGKSIHFVIMKSVFNTELEIHKIWDLKGSTLGRRAKRGDSVHKDLDLLEEGRKLRVGERTKEGLIQVLKKDTDFLAKMHIMDYSMLLGVHLQTLSESVKYDKRSLLSRTNTPMRRKNFLKRNEDESVIEHFLNNSNPRVSASGSGSFETFETHNSYDEDTDDSDREVAESSVFRESFALNSDVDNIPDISTTLSTLDVSKYHENVPPNPYSIREDRGVESKTGDRGEIYFAGVIDILQMYNTRKWGETIMRKTIGNAEKDISCVSPEVYANRFVEFIDDLLE